MRIPLTKYGLPQVVIYPAVLLAVMVAVWLIGELNTHYALLKTLKFLE
jgi:hypothetical protein